MAENVRSLFRTRPCSCNGSSACVVVHWTLNVNVTMSYPAGTAADPILLPDLLPGPATIDARCLVWCGSQVAFTPRAEGKICSELTDSVSAYLFHLTDLTQTTESQSDSDATTLHGCSLSTCAYVCSGCHRVMSACVSAQTSNPSVLNTV